MGVFRRFWQSVVFLYLDSSDDETVIPLEDATMGQRSLIASSFAKMARAMDTKSMDMLFRLFMLEGATGKGRGQLAKAGRPAQIAAALQELAVQYPEMHPSWTSLNEEDVYDRSYQVIAPILRQHPRISPSDILQDMVAGISAKTGKPVENVFFSVGKKFGSRILEGGEPVRGLLGYALNSLKRRAKGEIRDYLAKGEEELDVSLSDESTDFNIRQRRNRTEILIDALQDRRDSRSRAAWKSLIEMVPKVVRGDSERVVINRYLRALERYDGSKVLPVLTKELGMDKGYIVRVMSNFKREAEKLIARDRFLQSIIEEWMAEGTMRVANSKRASARSVAAAFLRVPFSVEGQ